MRDFPKPVKGGRKLAMIKYRVVAKGGEIIYEGDSLTEADHAFEIFKSQSRESDVLVTLMQDSDIVKQWYRRLNDR